MAQSNQRFRIEHWIVAAFLFTMAAIAFVNILSRYLFHGLAFERGGQLGMITLYNLFPQRFKRFVIVFSAALSAALFLLVDIYMVQAIYEELTLFNATSAALGIPVWIYYIGVPIFSVFVFSGIYRDAATKLGGLKHPGGE